MEKNKKITGIVLGVLLLIAVGCTLFSTAYSVSEQEQAVVTMFGKVQSVKNAGIYFKIPYIQHVTKVDTTTHGTGIGYTVSDSGQNIDSDESESLMITSDFNFVNIDFYLEYKVSDPVAYLYNSSDPEEILKNFVLAAVRSTVIDYPVDEVITTAKSQIQSEVKDKVAKSLEENNIGLQIINISVQDAEPPTVEIVQAFKEVETAKQSKDTAINNANQYRNEQLPAAQAEADRIIQNAEACQRDVRSNIELTDMMMANYRWMLMQPLMGIDNMDMAAITEDQEKAMMSLAADLPMLLIYVDGKDFSSIPQDEAMKLTQLLSNFFLKSHLKSIL